MLSVDPDQIKAAMEAVKNQDSAAALQILEALLVSAAGASPSSIPPADGDPSAQGADSPPVVTAALSQLRKLTGRASLGEVVAEFTSWKAARDSAVTDQQALEQTSRVELTAELVRLGYELPATAWEGDPKDSKPAEHIASMPIAKLRARVVSLRAAPRAPQAPVPPTRPTETVTVTQSDRDGAKKLGITVEEFQQKKKDLVRRV